MGVSRALCHATHLQCALDDVLPSYHGVQQPTAGLLAEVAPVTHQRRQLAALVLALAASVDGHTDSADECGVVRCVRRWVCRADASRLAWVDLHLHPGSQQRWRRIYAGAARAQRKCYVLGGRPKEAGGGTAAASCHMHVECGRRLRMQGWLIKIRCVRERGCIAFKEHNQNYCNFKISVLLADWKVRFLQPDPETDPWNKIQI